MINRLRLKNSSSPARSPLEVETPSVTIFVGPNNAGKSQALREIFGLCTTGDLNSVRLIIDRLIFEEDPNPQADFDSIKLTPRVGDALAPNHSLIYVEGQRVTVSDDFYIRARRSPNENTNYFAQTHLRHFSLNLDGPNRIGLVTAQQRGDLKTPATQLARLLTNDAKRDALRKTIFEALGLHFAIDCRKGTSCQFDLDRRSRLMSELFKMRPSSTCAPLSRSQKSAMA
jgi:hypothetical protein